MAQYSSRKFSSSASPLLFSPGTEFWAEAVGGVPWMRPLIAREMFPIEADLARDGPIMRMARPSPRKTKAKLVRFREPTTFFFISAKLRLRFEI
jgi:hypothetical protein